MKDYLGIDLETSTLFSGFSNIIQNDLIESIGDVITVYMMQRR